MKFTTPEDDEIARLRKTNADLQRQLATAHEALGNIRSAGENFSDWAVWAQRTAAWGMAPDKWPKQNTDAPLDTAQRQLDEVTRERDYFKLACEAADQLRNYERGL